MKLKKPNDIHRMLGHAAAHLPEAAEALVGVLSSEPGQRAEDLERLHAIEVAADDRYAKLLRKVTSTFVTPFDREDLYAMMSRLDDVIDEIDHAGSMVDAFALEPVPEQLLTNARDLVPLARTCAQAPELIKKPKKLGPVFDEIARCENKLDDGFRVILASTLSGESLSGHQLQVMTVANSIERAATGMELFIRALGVTAIKET